MRGLTVTERNWLKSVGIVLGSIVLFWAIALAEGGLGVQERARLVRDPVETSMRILAIPHFLMGFAFLVTSRAMRRPRAWIWLAGLAALGVALCRLFSELGPPLSRLPQLVLLLYFGVHAFRDEAHFFVVNGDAPAGAAPKRIGWAVLLAPLLLAWVFIAWDTLGAAFDLGDHRRYTTEIFRGMPAGPRWALGALPLASLVLAIAVFRRRVARMPAGTAQEFLHAYRPILVICGGIALIILLEIAIQGRSRALVTLHVTGWYVFAMYQLARRPAAPAPRPLTWTWMRATRPGFAFLHVGLAAVALVLCVVAAYGFRNGPSQPAALTVLSSKAFPYWTIMHITTSFLPKS